MPWKETDTVELREALVMAILAKQGSVRSLCQRAGVSCKTAYKWVARFKARGALGLEDQSRARLTQDHAVSDEVIDLLLTTREEHPTWGAKKLLPFLARNHPHLELPCLSTVGDILCAAGVTVKREPSRKIKSVAKPTSVALGPNCIWTIDFKGQFRLGCARDCYPLTVVDAFSRFILCVDGKWSTQAQGVCASLQRTFKEYGIPVRIKSDNGSPFAGSGLARLTKLSVWLISHGVLTDLIQPGCPGQNGSHERMHRTLKAETTRPPSHTLQGQQRRFNRFINEYNTQRPHEAIGQKTPSMLYEPSPRTYQGEQPDQDMYPGHWIRRQVKRNGFMKWKGEAVFLSCALGSRRVGLVEVDDGLWEVYYQRMLLAMLDERGQSPVIHDVLARTSS
jgi:putative transposase